jgi:hypothetical protein
MSMSKPTHFYATWVSAEAVDSNLSIIDTKIYNELTGTSHVRWVPKLSHVTGLTTSSTVLCTINPVCIIGIVVGDVKKASI